MPDRPDAAPPGEPVAPRPGDVVLVQDAGETFYGVVVGERLGRVRLRPCADPGRERACSRRAVLQVFRAAGAPAPAPARLTPDPQLRFRL